MKVMATSPPPESLSVHVDRGGGRWGKEGGGDGWGLINKDIGLHGNNMEGGGGDALLLLVVGGRAWPSPSHSADFSPPPAHPPISPPHLYPTQRPSEALVCNLIVLPLAWICSGFKQDFFFNPLPLYWAKQPCPQEANITSRLKRCWDTGLSAGGGGLFFSLSPYLHMLDTRLSPCNTSAALANMLLRHLKSYRPSNVARVTAKWLRFNVILCGTWIARGSVWCAHHTRAAAALP